MLTHSPSASPARPGRCWRRHIVVGVLAVLTAGASFVYGPRLGGIFARQVASRRISACEFGPCNGGWLGPPGSTPAITARPCSKQPVTVNCSRWRPGGTPWTRRNARCASLECITSELKLDSFRRGGLRHVAETEMGDLATAGVPLSDITSTFLCGYLANDARQRARLLQVSPSVSPMKSTASTSGEHSLRARRPRQCRNPAGKRPALAARTRAACDELATLFEDRIDPDFALRVCRTGGSFRRKRDGDAGPGAGLAEAGTDWRSPPHAVPLASQPEPSPSVQVEMANIELELGNYEQAERRFRQMPLEESANDVLLIPAALTLALRKKPLDAERLFAKTVYLQHGNAGILETAGQQSATRRDGFA